MVTQRSAAHTTKSGIQLSGKEAAFVALNQMELNRAKWMEPSSGRKGRDGRKSLTLDSGSVEDGDQSFDD